MAETREKEDERVPRLRSDLASLRIERSAPVERPSRRRGGRRLRVAAILVVAAALVAWFALGGGPQRVSVAPATRSGPGEDGAPLLSGSGYVVTGDRYVSIGVRVAGRIDRYFIEEGQSVAKGDPLVQLDDRDYRAAVARAEAALELARANQKLADADLRRSEALRANGVLSAADIDVQRNRAAVARATIAQIEAELAQARVNLDYTTLRAPTDGVVLAKLKEVGEIAVPGGFSGSGDLVRIANLDDIRAEVDVNESDLGRVRMGGRAQVSPDAYPEARFDARVVKLYPQVDRQKGTLKVEVKILEPDERLLPDMSARVNFLAEAPKPGEPEAPTVLVPEAAVHREGDESQVWVVADGRARKVKVETAGEVGGRVRIASGLAGGESVVVGTPPTRDGQPVVVETGK